MRWVFILLCFTAVSWTQPELDTGQYMSQEELPKTGIAKRARRAFVISCCGRRSCQGPRRPNRRRYTYAPVTTEDPLAVFQYSRPKANKGKAVAVYSEDGFSISCNGCPQGWQSQLAFEPAPKSSIPVICPNCPEDWQDLLDLEAYLEQARRNKRNKTSETDDESYSDSEDENTDEESTEAEEEEDNTTTTKVDNITMKFNVTTAPLNNSKLISPPSAEVISPLMTSVTVTTISVVIDAAQAITPQVTTVATVVTVVTNATTFVVTTAAANTTAAAAGGGIGGILSGGLGNLLGNVGGMLGIGGGGGGGSPTSPKSTTTQASGKDLGFVMD